MKLHQAAAGNVNEHEELMRNAEAEEAAEAAAATAASEQKQPAQRRTFVQTAAGLQKDKQNLIALSKTGFLAPAASTATSSSSSSVAAAASAAAPAPKDAFHLATMTKKRKRDLKHEKLMSRTLDTMKMCCLFPRPIKHSILPLFTPSRSHAAWRCRQDRREELVAQYCWQALRCVHTCKRKP